MALEAGIKSGANWFYWIAGLSLINTISALSGSNWRFLLGLGATEIVNSVAANLGGAGKIAAVIVDAFIAGSFVFFGVFSNKFQKWAFLVGMVLFGLDGLLELLFQSWLSAAFHGYAIYCIYRGYQKLGLLEKLKAFGNVAV